MQISRILVPFELTKLSDIATDYALEVALQLKVKEVILLNIIIPAHVQTSSAAGGVINSSVEIAHQLNMTMMGRHKEVMEEKAKAFSTSDVKAIPVVRLHNSKADLNHFMKEFGADLIVTGSRDKFSFLEILFGSDTEKMIRKIDFPMIVLTGKPVSSQIKSIALALNVALQDEQHVGLEDVMNFAFALEAHLQLIYVITNNSVKATVAIEKLQQLARKKKMKNYSINVVDNHSLETGLQGFARKFNPDLVAVLTHGKGKIHNLIYGSSTGEVIKELEIPVFVAKPQ